MELEHTVLDAMARALTGSDPDAVATVNGVKDEVEVGRLLGCGVEVALGDYPRPDRGFGEAAEEADREWQEHRINFGLQLIHHVVEHRWDECGEEARAGAKTVAIMLADALAPDPGVLEAVGSRFLLRKVAALFAAIGVREWPQRWPDLIDSLVDRASGDPNGAGGGHVFLACATVRNLVEEVYEFGHTMQGDRRRDLVKSLDEVAPQYLGMLAATLANGVEALRQREHIPTEAVLCEVLDGLKACFDHSPLPPLLEAGFLPLLCEVLHHPTLRQAAADCLLLGVARKGQLADRVPLLALLDNFELVTGAVPSPDPHDAESHTFLKRLCQFVSVLGSNQVCAVWAGQGLTKDAPANLAEYLYAILILFQHKSRLVSSFALAAWQQLYRHDLAPREEVMREALPPLIDAILQALPKRGNMAEGFGDDVELEAYALLDFDDDEEFVEFFGVYRNNMNHLTRQIAVAFPDEALEAAVTNVVSVSERESASVADWDAATCFLEQVMSITFTVIDAHPEKYSEVLGAISTVMGNVAGFDLQEGSADIQVQLFSLIEALVPILGFLDPALVEAVLHLVLAGIRMEGDGGGGDQDEEGWKGEGARVRHKACQALTAFCRRPPPALFASFGAICAAVQEVMVLPTTSEMTRKWLMIACVEAGNHLPTFQEHGEYLQQLLAPALETLNSVEVQGALESPAALADFGGLYCADPLPFQTARQVLIGALQAVAAAVEGTVSRGSDDQAGSGDSGAKASGAKAAGQGKKAPTATVRGGGGAAQGGDGQDSASANVTRDALLPVLRLIAVLHQTWEPGVTPPEYSALLDLRRAEMMALLAKAGRSMSRDMTAEERCIDRAQLWLGTLRESCYRIMRAAARQGVLYEMDDLLTALADSCFVSVEHMHPHHVAHLLKMVAAPIVQYGPRSDDGVTFLSTLLSAWYAELRGYLATRWERHLQVAAKQGADQANPLEEVLDNTLLSGLTHDAVTHLAQLIADDTGRDKVVQLGPLAVELLAVDSVCEHIVSLLLSALSWPHALSARVASNALLVVFDPLIENRVFQEFAGSGYVLSEVLRGLSTHGSDDACNNSLVGMVAAVYRVARIHGIASAIEPLSVVPGCDRPGAFAALDALLEGPAAAASKRLKPQLRVMLKGIAGTHVGQLRREVKITALPEKLFLLSEQRELAARENEDTESGLGDFFSLFEE